MTNARQVLTFGTRDEMADFMVEKWAALSGEAVEKRGRFTAALSGGETPVLFYLRLASAGERLSWKNTHLFLADERFVSLDNADSNYHLISETLLKNVPIPAGNIHAVPAGESDLQLAAAKYEEEIIKFFALPAGVFPEFDLIMLGMGADGHTASLFPGDIILNDTRHIAAPVSYDKVKHDRITLTLPVINNARTVIFLVSGKAKVSVLRGVADDRDPRFPASLVNPQKGDLLFLADAEAAHL